MVVSRKSFLSVGLIAVGGYFMAVLAPDPPPPEPEAWTFPFSKVPVVVIDPGHGGQDSGAQFHGVLEKNLTLSTALRLEKVLRARGYTTVLTRAGDAYVSLPERVFIANQIKGPSIFVSIHFNMAPEGRSSGIETFYADEKVPYPADWSWIGLFEYPQSAPDRGEGLAESVHRSLLLQCGAHDRGVRARHLFVTRHTFSAAILVEGGFITSPSEGALVQDGRYEESIARGIANGIEAWMRPPEKRFDFFGGLR